MGKRLILAWMTGAALCASAFAAPPKGSHSSANDDLASFIGRSADNLSVSADVPAVAASVPATPRVEAPSAPAVDLRDAPRPRVARSRKPRKVGRWVGECMEGLGGFALAATIAMGLGVILTVLSGPIAYLAPVLGALLGSNFGVNLAMRAAELGAKLGRIFFGEN